MAGALIPDDWDGVTYKCWKVKWPDSLDYSAILLGNVSKPSYLDYWDADTGDAQAASNAIKEAYNTTLPDFWAEDCEDPILATKSFRVRNTVSQSIPAATWTKVVFDEFVWNVQTPGWNLAENAQDLTLPASAGIWQYNAGVVVASPIRVLLAVRLNNYYPIQVAGPNVATNALASVSWNVSAAWTWCNLWIYTGVATTISVINDASPWFSGHLVKSIEEA